MHEGMDHRPKPRRRRALWQGLSAVVLVAIGAAGGAGAMSLTRPPVEMAPTVPTTVAQLASARGVVTVKGQVAEVYGDRFIVADDTGRAMVDAGPGAHAAFPLGSPVTVQGRFDGGQLRARFLVDASGTVQEVGPPPPPPHGLMRLLPPPPPPGAAPPPPAAAATPATTDAAPAPSPAG